MPNLSNQMPNHFSSRSSLYPNKKSKVMGGVTEPKKADGTATNAWTTTLRDASVATGASRAWTTSWRLKSKDILASSLPVAGNAPSAATTTSRAERDASDAKNKRQMKTWMECQSTYLKIKTMRKPHPKPSKWLTLSISSRKEESKLKLKSCLTHRIRNQFKVLTSPSYLT